MVYKISEYECDNCGVDFSVPNEEEVKNPKLLAVDIIIGSYPYEAKRKQIKNGNKVEGDYCVECFALLASLWGNNERRNLYKQHKTPVK